MRAYTPKDQKAVKVAAQSFRANPAFDTEKAITELATGEALISFLDEKGAPNPVERAFILPPEGQIGPITSEERSAMITGSMLNRFYANTTDRESAYEKLTAKLDQIQQEKESAIQSKEDEKRMKEEAKIQKAQEKADEQAAKKRTKVITTLASAVLIPLGKQLIRSFMGKKR